MARKTRIRRLSLIAMAAALAGLLTWLYLPRAAPVETAQATVGPIAETVSDQGATQIRDPYVVSAPAAGRLTRIALEVGDVVKAGQTVVAELRPAPADPLDPRARGRALAAVAAAQAGIASAEAQVGRLAAEAARARSELARLQPLAEKGFASAQALELAQTARRTADQAVRAAEAETRARRAEAEAARAALIGPDAAGVGLMAVKAPVSGYVTRVLQRSERTVAGGTPLVEIGDRSGLEADIEFLSQDAVRIREGMEAEIYDWGGPLPLAAVVRRVEPQGFTKVSALGIEEQRVIVRLTLKEPGAAARLGPAYRVWGRVILRRAPRALKVPVGALVRDQGRWAVFRVEDGRARLRPLEVGAMTDQEAEVRGGLSAGDRVVVFPSDRIADGRRVADR